VLRNELGHRATQIDPIIAGVLKCLPKSGDAWPELERLNPRTERGHRKYHHHRFLTGEIGHPHLEKQVAVVTALMRVSPDWDAFMRNFNRNFRPHMPEQKDLFEELGPLPDNVKNRPDRGIVGALLSGLEDEAAD
jgi:hypothetical protein